MSLKISTFQSFSTNDGPGIRGVLFLQGCPLRCKCCHNPETWNINDGSSFSVEQLYQKIIRNKNYYLKGGITFSGGEPLMQSENLLKLAKMLKAQNVHITLDTSGCILNDDVKALLYYCDLVLLDIKKCSENEYYDFAKGSLKQTLLFLNYLKEINKDTWIRHVVVKGLNNNRKNIDDLYDITKNYGNISKVELLAFHKHCESKYRDLNLEFEYETALEPSQIEITDLQVYLDSLKVDI